MGGGSGKKIYGREIFLYSNHKDDLIILKDKQYSYPNIFLNIKL